MISLNEKVALITGAARGQGEAEARLFVKLGARVVLGDVRDDSGKKVAESIGDAAIYVHHDVSHEESWSHFVSAALDAFGRIDVLVNNAGILGVGSILDTTLEEYMSVIDVNQVGTFLGMKAVIPAMTEARGGSIVNISSVAGLGGVPGMVSYVSSKFAIRGMTKVASLELGPLGIRVNSVHPGGVDTEMVAGQESGLSSSQIALGRIGKSSELAKLVAFLASDAASYCTGSEFTADGGMLAAVQMGGTANLS